MRGLLTRILLAHTRIANILDPDGDSERMLNVYCSAHCDGAADWEAGLTTPPLQFAGEPVLLDGWRQGFNERELIDAIEECAYCHSSHDPCPIHD